MGFGAFIFIFEGGGGCLRDLEALRFLFAT